MRAISPEPPASSSPRLILLGLWIGLLTGFAEVIVHALKLYVIGEFLTLSRHAVWLIPLTDAAIFTLLGALLALLHRTWPRIIAWSTAVGVLILAGAIAVLFMFAQIHVAASLLLAAGIAVQAARWLGPRRPAVQRIAAKSATGLVTIVIAIAAWFILRAGIGERRALSGMPDPPRGAPNILLIILDTVRAKNLSLYGYPRPTTPEIDRWAEGGLVVERAISTASWTLPSHASMFTGRHPHELDANWKTPLERSPLTLAEALSERGYATAGFVANFRYAGWETGLGRGFNHYEDYHLSLGEALKSVTLANGFHKVFARVLGLPTLRPRTDASQINQWFLRWVDGRNDQRPFFVFLNYLYAHDPYEPPDSFRERFAPNARGRLNDSEHLTLERVKPQMDLYDGSIAYLDSVVGGLFRELAERGMLEHTLVILTSDHGEEFAEHQILGHAASLYRPSVEVPLVLSYPGKIPPGRTAGPVSLRDLAATIMDVSGHREPRLPGTSWAKHWAKPSEIPQDAIVATIRKTINRPDWWPASQGDMLSILRGRYRYILNQGTGKEELFDFEGDISEQRDLFRTPEGQRELPAFRRSAKGFTTSPSRR